MILNQMKHKRDLVLGVIFKPSSNPIFDNLEVELDKSHLNDMNKK